jgi:predicted phage tail protein
LNCCRRLEETLSASQEPGQLQEKQQLQSPLALSLSHDMSSLQHQVHQVQASCTLLEQQQQSANTSTTAVASTMRKFEQRMQQLEQQGQRQLSSSKAADSAVVQRLHSLEQQVACLGESLADTKVSALHARSEYILCNRARSAAAAAASHGDQNFSCLFKCSARPQTLCFIVLCTYSHL